MDRGARQSRSAAVLNSGLDKAEGMHLCTAGEALLKSVFESELPVSLIALPDDPAFQSVLEAMRSGLAQQVLADHDCTIEMTDTAARAVQQAGRAARNGRGAVALVPNSQLDRAMPELTTLMQGPSMVGGSLCVVLEDRPGAMPASYPRRAAARLGMPTLEPADLQQLRDMLAVALRLSRGVEQAAAMVVHESILRSMQTMEMRPNRAGAHVTILRADRRRQRKLRFSESRDVLRLARRLELNVGRALPNPGERVSIGFVTVGPADEALRHLTHVLKLHGRIPVLSLGLLHPLDETALGRLLTRCDKVVVLEPRPGSMEMMLLQVAERLRRSGETVATIWGRQIPADAEGRMPVLESDDDLHPSILVRKILHLLHDIRPTLSATESLLPAPPVLNPDGEDDLARPVANDVTAYLREHLVSLDRWLREQTFEGEDGSTGHSALAIDGVVSGPGADRVVIAELWDRAGFLETGIGAVAQAAASKVPWVMVISDIRSRGEQDVERLVKSAIPARYADRVQVRSVDIKNAVEVRTALRDAAMRDNTTVVLVRDAPPARFDEEAIARELRDVDQLGFEPLQRAHWSADQSCAIRAPSLQLPAGEAVSAEAMPGPSDMRVDALPERLGRQFRARVRLLEEYIEVTRTRAPVPFWRGADSVAVPAGRPVHSQQSHWRAHVAGIRGPAPGVAVRVLCEAGQQMGYDVQCLTDPRMIGPGRAAWSQVLFYRRDASSWASSQAVTIPYGEADLLLGLVGAEVVHAVDGGRALQVGSPHVTYLVANTGSFAGESRQPDAESVEQVMRRAVGSCVRADRLFLQNVAAACRAGFYSDRVTDMVLLGAAFQRGLIPVTYAAMVSALKVAEAAGVGRATETFDFGRRLAEDPQLLSRPRLERVESISEMRKRMRLSLGLGRGRRQRGARFDELVDTCLRGMPGLTETDAGRQARRDLLAALYRCQLWGGASYAERYADLIVQLYHVDRGDTGRALTRAAILPLAEAMLIRDPLFVAAMTMSAEHRRRLRQQLNIKPARGDQLERRYLVRLELSVAHRRFRADVRTSDWIARVLSAARRLVPKGVRGSRRDRRVREAVTALVNQARFDPPELYERNQRLLQTLHDLAERGRLRSMPYSELEALMLQHDVTLMTPREPVDEVGEDLLPEDAAESRDDAAATSQSEHDSTPF